MRTRDTGRHLNISNPHPGPREERGLGAGAAKGVSEGPETGAGGPLAVTAGQPRALCVLAERDP